MFDPAFGLTLWKTLAGLFLAAGLLAFVTRRWQPVALVGLLLADWALCTSAPSLKGEHAVVWNWIAWGAVDTIMGLLVALLIGDSVVALAIMFILLCEVAAHIAFGATSLLRGDPDYTTQIIYWTFTHWGAWLQVWLLGIWMGRDAIQMVGSTDFGSGFRRDDRHLRDAPSSACQQAESGK